MTFNNCGDDRFWYNFLRVFSKDLSVSISNAGSRVKSGIFTSSQLSVDYRALTSTEIALSSK